MEPYKLKLLLVLVGFFAVVGLPLWWMARRSGRQQARERQEELTAFANNVGGTVADAGGDVLPWSADLASPFLGDHDGVMAMLTTANGPRFDYALEFERNGWRVRVCEASVELRRVNSPNATHTEHRIEVATADHPAPLKIVIGSYARGRRFKKWAAEMPRTVAGRERPLWTQSHLPELADHPHLVFTSDLPAAAEMLNEQVVAWMRAHADGKLLQHLTFEAGIVHTSASGRIEEQSVLDKVDALLDLLDRMPGARPAHPAATA
jgi:hypothetical protein